MRTNRRAIQRAAFAASEAQTLPIDLRRRLGHWLRVTRIDAGMTQRDLADLVGLEGVNHISAIENGRGNIPPERYTAFSEALGMSRVDFAKVILRHTDPWLFQAITASRDVTLLAELKMIDQALNPKVTPDDNVAGSST